jgi:hypothetical protein
VEVVEPEEVDVVAPMLVEVVEPEALEVDVVLPEVVTVTSLVEVVSSVVVGVDGFDEAVVADVTDVAVSADVLVDDPALVTDVEVSSPLLAQATPTTRTAAATAVRVAAILRNMVGLLFCLSQLSTRTGQEVFSGVSRRSQSFGSW